MFARIRFGAGSVRYVGANGRPRDALRRELPRHDVAYVIAPESGGMLAGLIEMTQELRGLEASLNLPSSAVREASDKLRVCESLKSSGLAVPKSLALDTTNPRDSAELSSTLGFPLVLKPMDGTGCEGLRLAFDEKNVEQSIEGYTDAQLQSPVIAQEYVRGIPASVSMLCSTGTAMPLSLNRQVVLLDRQPGRSLYMGGVVPLDHAAGNRAFQAACEAAEALGLRRGYVGVDLVLARDGPVIVDVNPRLTTSYIGLRKTASLNVAEWMVRSCLQDELPVAVQHRGYSIFLKVPTPATDSEGLKRLSLADRQTTWWAVGRSGVETTYAMVEAHGDSLMKAITNFKDARSTLIAPGRR